MNECKPLPDGTQIASALSDETVCVWDVNTGLTGREAGAYTRSLLSST